MPELDDVQIDRPPHGPQDRGPRTRRSSALVWVMVLLLLVGVGAALYYFLVVRGSAEPPAEEASAPAETVAPPAEATAGTPGEGLELPPLSASDEVVRRLAGSLSEHPALASWLATDGLVRRFVVIVDNLAVGLLPKKQLPASMAPEGRFSVTEAPDGTVTEAPGSSARYNRFAAVVASIDAEGAVETYERLKPLVDEAAEELGYGKGTFDGRLVEAIQVLLRAPVPSAPPKLVEGVMSYRYADPRWQELPEVQKQMVRMGPQNERLVQAKLREILRAMDVPEDQIPKERTIRPDAE